jgi:hypothetical protein
MLDRFKLICGDRSYLPVWRDRLWQLTAVGLLLIFLTSCSVPRVASEDRVFLNLSLDFLGEYQLPQNTFEEVPVGGISGIAYDRVSSSVSGKPGFRFYGVSGDSGKYAPPRFYTLRLALTSPESEEIGIAEVEIENVTFLKKKDGEFFSTGKLYPEGIVLSPRETVFVASVGKSDRLIPPLVGEFDLNTGKLFASLPVPDRYLSEEAEGDEPQGVRDGRGFDALTLDPTTFSPDGLDPFRLFVGVESPLLQDDDGNGGGKLRVLHYEIADRASLLISENFYPLDETLESSADSSLADLVALGKGGYFLSLERSGGLSGKSSFFGSIFEIFSGDATDTSRVVSLKEELPGVKPVRKKLLLDLADVDIPGGNLSGMTLGPHLSDGSQSLVVVSNEEVDGAVVNRFLLFRLVES